MRISAQSRQASLAVAAALVGCAGVPTGGSAELGVSNRVTPYPDAIQRLATTLDTVVVSERSVSPAVPLAAVEGRRLPDLLAEISAGFDVHWTAFDGVVTFQRRYSDSREAVELDLDEIRGTVRAVYALVHPQNPLPAEGAKTPYQKEFLSSLTPEQLAAMRNGGLAFRDLAPAQQKLWLTLNSAHHYGSADLAFGRLSELFEKWGEATVGAPAVTPNRRQWEIAYPGRGVGGLVAVHFPIRDLPEARIAPGIASGEDRRSLTAPPVSPAFSRRFAVQGGPTTLDDLMKLLERASGKTIAIPDCAKSRTVLIYGKQTTVRRVLTGLEELYGWQLRAGTRGRYILDRPAPGVPRDAYELQTMLHQALPPAMRRLIERDPGAKEAWLYHQMEAALPPQKYSELQSVRYPLTKLAPEQQNRLAQAAALVTFYPENGFLLNRTTPRLCVSHPEQGFFTWEGPDAPIPGGKNPLIWFGVRGPGSKLSRWGWVVGSSAPNPK